MKFNLSQSNHVQVAMATSPLFLIVADSEKLAAPVCYKANSDSPTECLHSVGGPETNIQSN